jgi:hypothetical protein
LRIVHSQEDGAGLAHGNDTDAHGQLVTETQGRMEMAYRLLVSANGSRMSLQAFYANKNAQSHQAALKKNSDNTLAS